MRRSWNVRLAGAMSLLALTVAVTASAREDEKKTGTVKVVNESDWALNNLFMSPANETEWGPDQLGDELIKKGGTFTLSKIPCDIYDVKLVDEDGDECVVEDVNVCGGKETWTITSKDLLKCQEASKED
ncbi:MAG: hypothetical protein IV100_24740 [Myxococcales bacterium]|nr:hypothetical protein [Myxococcales bacterium]